MLTKRLAVSLTLLAAISLSAASSHAQSKQGEKNENDSGVLAGPRVDESADKPGGGMMGPQGQVRERRGDDLPFQQWMAALRGLSLSEAQQTKIRAIADEFQKAQREHTESLGEEGRALMRQMREARQSGNPPPDDVREKMRKIEESRPKPIAYQQRIWAELSAEQQEAMKKSLEERRQRMQEQRERRRQEGMTSDDGMKSADERAARRRPNAESEMESETDRETAPAPQRRRAAGRPAQGATRLDDMGRKRLEFLRSKQSKNVRSPGRPPTPEDRRFEFEDDRK